MTDIPTFTHLLYDISGAISKLRMKDIQMRSGAKLNTAAMSMLNVIDRNPGMSVTDLSKQMNLTKSAVSQMLKKLCALGLTTKNKNDGNGKTVYPELTEAGKMTAAEYREQHERFYLCMTDLLNRYDPNEQELIRRFLTEAGETIRDFSISVENRKAPNKQHRSQDDLR